MATPLGLPPKTMPNLNTFRILSLVWKRRSISRIEVAAELCLTKSTITKITGQLILDGLLIEAPVTKPEGRGRPRVALSLNLSRGVVLGLEIRTDGWSSVLVRFDGSIARKDSGKRSWNPETLVEDWADLLQNLTAVPSDGVPVLGVGLALPGIVNCQTGELIRSNPLDIQNPVSVGPGLERRLGIPVTLENDANCGCWGELAFGSPPLAGPFLFTLCEDRLHRTDEPDPHRVAAIGFGLVLGGKPWRGPDHSAGEFSSILKTPSAERSYQFNLSNQDMMSVFRDSAIHEALVEELGKNVALMVNFLNLKTVYVLWPSSGDADAVHEAFRRLISSNWLYPTPVECVVSAPTGGADAISWGAAGYFLEVLWGDSSFEEAQPRWK